MNCRRCHKPLKREPGVSNGIGPVCARKEQFEAEMQDKTEGHDMRIVAYNGGDIFCRREGDTKVTNVPWRKVLHSPDGYEWGYAGSGPADFALNILLMFLPEDRAMRLHQQFKFDFISPMHQLGGFIKRTDIEAWIEAHRRAA